MGGVFDNLSTLYILFNQWMLFEPIDYVIWAEFAMNDGINFYSKTQGEYFLAGVYEPSANKSFKWTSDEIQSGAFIFVEVESVFDFFLGQRNYFFDPQRIELWIFALSHAQFLDGSFSYKRICAIC